MNKLVLFDIDGTLVKGIPNNPHALAFCEAIKNLYDIEVVLDWKEVQGLTDRLIFAHLLKKIGWTDDEIQAKMADLVDELGRVYVTNFKTGSVELYPGVKELLEDLEANKVQLGLVTGNLKIIAKTKLEDAGIYHYFTLGGFGSDQHLRRSELVELAVQRADQAKGNVYLIGDTPRDIEAATEAGVVHSVGVATSHHDINVLKESGAEFAYENLEDTNKILLDLGVT